MYSLIVGALVLALIVARSPRARVLPGRVWLPLLTGAMAGYVAATLLILGHLSAGFLVALPAVGLFIVGIVGDQRHKRP